MILRIISLLLYSISGALFYGAGTNVTALLYGNAVAVFGFGIAMAFFAHNLWATE